MKDVDLAIVGAGVAGLTAAMVAGEHGLKVAVLDQIGVGGQIANVERILNWPGFPDGIGGHELGPLLHQQAEAAGAEIVLDTVETIEPAAGHFIVRGAAETLAARAVIIAAGSALRTLGIPGEKEFRGKGMSHCASCDGALFAGREVCVIGGGDSALDEALVLAQSTARVTLIHRGPHLDAQQALRQQIAACPKIEVVLDTIVEEILGNDTVTGVRLRSAGATRLHATAGVFIYVGLEPNAAFLRDLLVLDAGGHIETDASMRTSVEGIFAAGDIRKSSVALLAAAAGDGATAAVAAFRYLGGGRIVAATKT
jgi:thioredoxin reductase (NADPH)